MTSVDDHHSPPPKRSQGFASAIGLLWLCLAGGTFLGLLPSGVDDTISFLLPISLTLAGVSILGLTSLCIWGLLFTIPGYFLAATWLRRRAYWTLPPLVLGQAAVTALQQALAGVAPWRETAMLLVILAGLLTVFLACDRQSRTQNLLSHKFRLLRRWLRRLKRRDNPTPNGIETRHD
ncbi:MAG TPA: hypothetical protein PLE92_02355 [Lentisphaeria bacterium]|nr:hypothetical protein [Lentisphaerota bacterium]OQC11745.1 MAG: hypothetical protein BWX73_03325 [Lentisphaerae bacterium ADurb.Bin082]HQC51947.1 hypothetical protein [Lentisphaeria bacterium]HQL87902.1 hypothetical protein [Lentisphaeria bacterium]